MSRTIHTDIIKDSIITLIHDASFVVPPEIRALFDEMHLAEAGDLARQALDILRENAVLSEREHLPLCQDCGMVTVFLEIGQGITWDGPALDQQVQDGVRVAYERFYLRKSIVEDPLRRNNTGTNTPANIHVEIVPGSSLTCTVYLKGEVLRICLTCACSDPRIPST